MINLNIQTGERIKENYTIVVKKKYFFKRMKGLKR